MEASFAHSKQAQARNFRGRRHGLARALSLLSLVRKAQRRAALRRAGHRLAAWGDRVRAACVAAVPTLVILGLLLALTLAAAMAYGHFVQARPPEGPSPEHRTEVAAAPTPSALAAAWTLTPAIPVVDGQGRSASFDLLVLSRDFQWRYESTHEVEQAGRSVFLGAHLTALGMRQLIGSSKALIVVASASEEGLRHTEEARAMARAEQLGLWVREQLPITQPLYALSLGQYAGAHFGRGPGATAKQRTIVLISVRAMDEGIDLLAALRGSLTQTPAFPFALAEYSDFKLSRQR